MKSLFVLFLSLILIGCTVVGADTFYTDCNAFIESINTDDSEDALVKKMDRYFSCGESNFSNYCESNKCSDVAYEFNQRMKAHYEKLLELSQTEGDSADADIWVAELELIFKWYKNNETALTEEAYNEFVQVLEQTSDDLIEMDKALQPTYLPMSGGSSSNRSNTTSVLSGICNLVSQSRGKTISSLSLNNNSGIAPSREPTTCFYKCPDGSSKIHTTQSMCPSTKWSNSF